MPFLFDLKAAVPKAAPFTPFFGAASLGIESRGVGGRGNRRRPQPKELSHTSRKGLRMKIHTPRRYYAVEGGQMEIEPSQQRHGG